MKRIVLFLFALAQIAVLSAAEQFISFSPKEGAVSLSNATIVYSDQDYEAVKIAIRSLHTDMERVLGKVPQLSTSVGTDPVPARSALTILIGTVGKNPGIDRLKLSGLKGCREKFIITAVQPSVVGDLQSVVGDLQSPTIVIAGSDRRGTVYGIYELSRQLGVSPWYWWADAPICRHDDAWFIPGTYIDGEPAVEFRGLFLNDEAPCLTSWVKHTFGTKYGDHRFYERVFELILRLRGNMLWPAMWQWAFYADDPENSRTADRMGIIMGTSHHEPMARNHQEYARHRKEWGAWNYQTNQAKLDQFFREGIERMKGTEDMVTIGMRGDGDEAMSDKADTRLMERIIANQRRIIKEVTGQKPEKTTQVWALYKEVQDYYDAGLRVPDDVMILISDDNWGDIRRVPTASERSRKGGWGIYYHVDYVGAPRNSKWINVTQTQQMFEQLSLAYDFGIQRMWILNVGDLKPMEYPIQLFMDMAWSPRDYTLQNVTDHTCRFFSTVVGHASGHSSASTVPSGFAAEAASTVPSGFAAEAASIYNQNCQYMARVTPEMLDASTYNLETGEWRRVADDYQRLELRALRLYDQVPEEARDCYRQTLLFPVQAMANLYDMYYAQAMNHHLANLGDPDANVWAQRVEQCFRRDSLLCHYYNKVMSGGKWDGMMTQKHIGYTSWNDDFPRDQLPAVQYVAVSQQQSPQQPQQQSPQQSPSVAGGFTFSHSDGYVSMEAEHFHSCTAAEGTQWTIYPYYGRTRSAVALTPYTLPTGDASLCYRFTLPEGTSQVKVHIVVKSTLDFLNVGGHEYTVSLDGSEPQVVNFNKTLLDRQPYVYSVFYPTIARRIVEKVVELPVHASADKDSQSSVGKDSQSAGTDPQSPQSVHELVIHPRHPGIVFEKIVVDFGGYRPSYLFMDESRHARR